MLKALNDGISLALSAAGLKTAMGIHRRHVFILILLYASGCFKAQEAIQVIRGRVVSLATQAPVGNFSIHVNGQQSVHTVGNPDGTYSVALAPGKYSLIVEAPGYKGLARENVMLHAGKQQVLDFELTELQAQLETVTVRSQSDERNFGLDLWNIQQFAAVFYDPARVAYSHPGVINVDDGTNQTTVRGTSPNYLQWKLEGVEIVNPNHLENAGTLNDRPAMNGGGVSIISAQLLQNSEFMLPAFDAASGNALSGIYDMRLRKGNDVKREHIVQASLLGTDISTEGPFSSRYRGSYLFNFRYSTIGLLSKMGIDFGDEMTNYSDFSHMIVLPYKRGVTKIFGMSGRSETLFSGQQDSSLLEIQKDLQNIDYHSFTTVNGASNLLGIGKNMYLKNVAVWSAKNISRDARPTGASSLAGSETDRFRQQKLSTLSYISARIGKQLTARLGTHLNYFTAALENNRAGSYDAKGELREPVLQPFLAGALIAGRFDITAGLHSQYLPRTGYFSLQPRLLLKYQVSGLHQLHFAYGHASQLQPFALVLGDSSNQSLAPTENRTYSLLHVAQLPWFSLKSELYFQRYLQIPVQRDKSFSAFNYFNELLFFPMESEGTAQVYGLDLRAEKNFRQFYVIASAGIFNSQYDQQKVSRFGTHYNSALTAGKEHRLRNSERYLSGDIRAVSRNGFREPEALLAADSYHYTRQLPQYWRIDLRFSYRKNKLRSSVIWALDLQNITNRRNVAYHYYDAVTKRVEAKRQLGLIPVLSYKVMF